MLRLGHNGEGMLSSSLNPSAPAAPSTVQRVSILAVIVLYRMSVGQCSSLKSLINSQALTDCCQLDLTMLVVDNSPTPQPLDFALPPNASIVHCPENLGLANAYNKSIQIAERSGITWLLTLDQDTDLPETFLADMAEYARQYQHDPGIAVILPHVQSGSVSLSPFLYRWKILPTWFPKNYVGIPDEPVFAINSASMLRVDALVQAGGYDPLFWLDCSDMAMFSRLHRLGKRVLVAGGIEVQHELSIKDMQLRLSKERYHHMLLAESAFWDSYMGFSAGFERTIRLALRLLRQTFQPDTSVLRSLTLRALLRRLFRSSRYRRVMFSRAVEQHLGHHFLDTTLPPRPLKVSVCMASYNSGRYIDLQLASILPQLSPQDEVIIIDDNSTDGTPGRIRDLADPRIWLIEHTTNAGVTSSFEQGLRAATGDVIFLSDHDDLWAPDKVQIFREAFAQGQHIKLVMSAVTLIDAQGLPFRNNRWDRGGQFQRGFLRNVLKNSYQGSSLALRSDFLGALLPFPRMRTYLHDAWIGTLNDRLGGGMVFIPKPLLLYRRHATNVSRGMTLGEKLLSRTQLLLDHLRHAFAGRGRNHSLGPR